MSQHTQAFIIECIPLEDPPPVTLPITIRVLIPAVPNSDFHCEECTEVYHVFRPSAVRVRSRLGFDTEREGRKPRVCVCIHYGRLIDNAGI